MGGEANIRGIGLQVAVACDLAVKLATDPELTMMRVEGAHDVADLELWAGDRLVSVVQVKSRAEHKLIGPADLAELIRRFQDVRAERYELVTDTGISRQAQHTILECASRLADGQPLDDEQQATLARLDLSDTIPVLSRLSVRPRYGDPEYLLDRALVSVHNAVGKHALDAHELHGRVARLFTALCVAGGQRQLVDRSLSVVEVRELLELRDQPPERAPQAPRTPETALHVLPPLDPTLIARPEVSEQVVNGMHEHPGAIVVALTGLPGTGKTELAVQIAAALMPRYRLAWWLEAEQTASVAAGLRRMLVALGHPRAIEADDSTTLALAREALRNQTPWLLVLDNIPGPGLLRDLGLAAEGHLLVTSRHPAWGGWGSLHEVPVFSESQAVALLTRHLAPGDIAEAPMLADDLGYLPLALAQAGAYLELSGRPIEQFRGLLAERLDVLDSPQAVNDAEGRYERSVRAMLTLLLEQLEEPLLSGLVALHAQLAPEPVPRWLLLDAVSSAHEPLSGLSENEVAFDQALAALNAAAVLRIGPDGSVMHRLTGRAARETLGDDEQLCEVALGAVAGSFPEDALQTSSWSRASSLLAHAHALLDRPGLLGSAHGAMLAVRVCALDHIQGRLADAEALARRALQTLPSGEERLRAQLLHSLGRTRLKNGNVLDAVDPLTQALTILEEMGERESLEYAAVETTLGAVLTELDTPEAASRLEDALEIQRRELPGSDKRIARTLIELAGERHAHGDYRGAERLEREALEIIDRPGADANVDLARGLGNLAGTLSEIPERRDETLEVTRRALAVTREVYGAEHPEVAYPLTTLATMLATEDPAKSYELLLQALRLRAKAFGLHHEQVAYTLEHLGDVLSGAKKPERALVWLQQSHELLRDIFDDQHVEVASASLGLGQVLSELGRYEAARPLIVAAIDAITRSMGPDHPEVQAARATLARLEARPQTAVAGRAEA